VVNWLIDIGVLVVCYLAGAIPSGLLISRQAAGIDIREHGSRNIGMTNVWRVLGWKLGLATLLADVLKAFAAVQVVPALGGAAIPALGVYAGAAVLIGNFFNVFLGGKGGKGVASSLGVFLALAPLSAAVVLVIFLAVVGLTRYISLGSVLAAAAFPVSVYTVRGVEPVFWLVLVIALLVILKHRANIGRLLKGTESRISFSKEKKV